VQHGTAYRLDHAVQFVRGAEVVVLAWQASKVLRLTALEAGATYRDRDTGVTYSAAVLMQFGLPLDLPPGDHTSALVRLERA
jgi:alpha-galactosidase